MIRSEGVFPMVGCSLIHVTVTVYIVAKNELLSNQNFNTFIIKVSQQLQVQDFKYVSPVTKQGILSSGSGIAVVSTADDV